MPMMTIRRATALVGCWIVAAVPAAGGDWPQVLGPGRDSQAIEERVEAWQEPPQVRWKFPCGAGYAGPAVVGDQVFLWHRVGDQEILASLDWGTGKPQWSAAFPASYTGGVDPDRGPRCVPVVSGDTVFVYGAAGDLHAVAKADGKKLWSRSLLAELQGEEGYFGAGSTPLAIGQSVIVAVGVKRGGGIVALDRSSGKTLWQALESEASYASPVPITLGGESLVVVPMRLKTVVIDPRTGEVRREFPFGRRGPSVVAATPLVDAPYLLVTASYGDGCRKMDLSANPPQHVWRDSQQISSQYVSPLRIGGHLYAITGREDFQDAALVCVGWEDGVEQWAAKDFGTAHLIAVGDSLLAVGVAGRLDLIAADPQAQTTLATASLPAGSFRALPALSRGLLFCRATRSPTAGELIAIELQTSSGARPGR